MTTLAFPALARKPGRQHDLADYLNNATALTLRRAADRWDTWERIVATALDTGHTNEEAEQMADDWLLTGEVVP